MIIDGKIIKRNQERKVKGEIIDDDGKLEYPFLFLTNLNRLISLLHTQMTALVSGHSEGRSE